MEVTVVLPPDYIGAPEIRFTLSVPVHTSTEALANAREQLEHHLPEHVQSAASTHRILSIGDVLIVEQQFYIVERAGFRQVSSIYCENWRRRSLVERLIGSGEYERVRASHSGMTAAV